MIISIILLALGVFPVAATPEQEGSGPEEVEIEFTYNTNVPETMDGIIARFEEQNPGITVKSSLPPELRGAIQARVLSGNVPDVRSTFSHEPGFQQEAREGWYIDLTDEDFMNRPRYSLLRSQLCR